MTKSTNTIEKRQTWGGNLQKCKMALKQRTP